MGSPSSEFLREKDEAQRNTTVSDFYMGTREVTARSYREVMAASPSEFRGDDRPVENVSWFDAVEYCNARSRKEGLTAAYRIERIRDEVRVAWDKNATGYRLPTEAEWEYAARAGTTTAFATGKNIAQTQANYYGNYPYTIEQHYFSTRNMDVPPGLHRGETMPVGSFEPNRFGLYDMHGNVGEWCWDWYGEKYQANQTRNPDGPSSGFYRVNRGGGWNDFGRHLRSAYRSALPPDYRSFGVGFRIARNAER